MAKSNKKSRKKNKGKKPIVAPPQAPIEPAVEAVPITEFAQPRYRKKFWTIFAVLGILSIIVSTQNGINGDDVFQNYYADHVLDYYTSGGADTSVFTHVKGPINIYGGFFEITTAVVNGIFGFESMDAGYHSVRHGLNTLFGLVAALFAALIVARWIGWKWAIFCFILLWLSPRFIGHAMINPKDIPFAAGYTGAVYFLLAIASQLPKPSKKLVLGFMLAMAVSFGIRVGALIIVGYLSLIFAWHFIIKFRKREYPLFQLILRYSIIGLVMVLGGVAIGILFWPYGLSDPIKHTVQAITEFSNLSFGIRILYGGENILSNDIPWYYNLDWIIRTVPIYVWIGLALIPYLIWQVRKKRVIREVVMGLMLVSFFPIAYLIYKDSALYDGWRHSLFIYPSLIALITYAFHTMYTSHIHKFKGLHKNIILGLFCLLIIEPLSYIVRNPGYPYTYFNPALGGVSNAFGNYELDYWGISTRQAFKWLEKEGLLQKKDGEPVVIVTSYLYGLQKLVEKEYKDVVKVKYTRYTNRNRLEWDYGIFPSRYVWTKHLKQGKWPTSKSIHNITANGVPITTIYENKFNYDFKAYEATKAKNYQEAIVHLENEIKIHPDNEIALFELANTYYNTGRVAKAQESLNKLFDVHINDYKGKNLQGLIYLNSGKLNEAEKVFHDMLKLQESGSPYYYLSKVYEQQNNLPAAIQAAEKAVNLMAKTRAAYTNLSQLYRKNGMNKKADRVDQLAQKL